MTFKKTKSLFIKIPAEDNDGYNDLFLNAERILSIEHHGQVSHVKMENGDIHEVRAWASDLLIHQMLTQESA